MYIEGVFPFVYRTRHQLRDTLLQFFFITCDRRVLYPTFTSALALGALHMFITDVTDKLCYSCKSCSAPSTLFASLRHLHLQLFGLVLYKLWFLE